MEYARYMNGGHLIKDLMNMKTRDFMFWFRVYERQIIEDKIITDYLKDKKEPPSGIALRNSVDRYIKNRREEINNNGSR